MKKYDFFKGSTPSSIPGTSKSRIQNPSRTPGRQIVFNRNPNFQLPRIKDGGEIGNRQTDRQTDEKVNSIEQIFFKNML
jgi:hypothetical protein